MDQIKKIHTSTGLTQMPTLMNNIRKFQTWISARIPKLPGLTCLAPYTMSETEEQDDTTELLPRPMHLDFDENKENKNPTITINGRPFYDIDTNEPYPPLIPQFSDQLDQISSDEDSAPHLLTCTSDDDSLSLPDLDPSDYLPDTDYLRDRGNRPVSYPGGSYDGGRGGGYLRNSSTNYGYLSNSTSDYDGVTVREHTFIDRSDPFTQISFIEQRQTLQSAEAYIMSREELVTTYVRNSHFTWTSFSHEEDRVEQIGFCTTNENCQFRTETSENCADISTHPEQWCENCIINISEKECKINTLKISQDRRNRILLHSDQYCRGSVISVDCTLEDMFFESTPPTEPIQLAAWFQSHSQYGATGSTISDNTSTNHERAGEGTSAQKNSGLNPPSQESFWSRLSWLFSIRLTHCSGDVCNTFKRVYFPALDTFFLDLYSFLMEGSAIHMRKSTKAFLVTPNKCRNSSQIRPSDTPYTCYYLSDSPDVNIQFDTHTHCFPDDLPNLNKLKMKLHEISKSDDTVINSPCSLQNLSRDKIVKTNTFRKYLLEIMQDPSDKRRDLLKGLFIRKHVNNGVIYCLKYEKMLKTHHQKSLRLFRPPNSNDVIPNLALTFPNDCKPEHPVADLFASSGMDYERHVYNPQGWRTFGPNPDLWDDTSDNEGWRPLHNDWRDMPSSYSD